VDPCVGRIGDGVTVCWDSAFAGTWEGGAVGARISGIVDRRVDGIVAGARAIICWDEGV